MKVQHNYNSKDVHKDALKGQQKVQYLCFDGEQHGYTCTKL